jgi:type III restriction enzyme
MNQNIFEWVNEQAYIWSEKLKKNPNSVEGNVIKYFTNKGYLRQPQIEAIQVYLWLKIAQNNRLFGEIISSPTVGEDALQSLAKILENLEINHLQTDPIKLNQYFHNSDYRNYVFSLPMGAGKTFLIAAIIYLDMYFAATYSDQVFADNFLILIPSALKNSILPSLQTIQHFDPSWVLPPEFAASIKRELTIEVLDQNKSGNSSNRAENPNSAKLSRYLYQENLRGLVLITNAEKVILDKVEAQNDSQDLFDGEVKDEKMKLANELRRLIGKIPNLGIFVDEYHHIQSSDNKLQKVIKQYASEGNLHGVYGFSGTPYSKQEIIIDNTRYKNDILTNTAYYFPLKQSVGNFLKYPEIQEVRGSTSREIVKQGLREFFARYKDTKYQNNTTAKLAIYCGFIDKLKDEILPVVLEFCHKNGIPETQILEYFTSNKDHKCPKSSQLEFRLLDSPHSTKRIVLLAQIGKEGWDCKSLTGVILAQESDSEKISVLQTSCRCLREVNDASKESALIVMNEANYVSLEKELKKDYQMSVADFISKPQTVNQVKIVDRTTYLEIPNLSIKQFHVVVTLQKTSQIEPESRLGDIYRNIQNKKVYWNPVTVDITKGFGDQKTHAMAKTHDQMYDTFTSWCLKLSKYLVLPFQHLMTHFQLKDIHAAINKNGYWKSGWDVRKLEQDICACFGNGVVANSIISDSTDSTHWVKDDINSKSTSILSIKNSPKSQKIYQKILDVDKDPNLGISEEKIRLIAQMRAEGMEISNTGEEIEVQYKDKTYHYLPYSFDSGLENDVFQHFLESGSIKEKGLQFFYNGDNRYSDIAISTAANQGDMWIPQGNYVPDFIIIQRDPKNNTRIKKALIVESKGELYKDAFVGKKAFMEGKFRELNPHIDFLYLLAEGRKAQEIKEYHKNLIEDKINEFFG